MPKPNPCLSCGVCCTMFRVSFYWAEADDAAPGGVPAELTEKFGPFRRIMRGTNGASPRCVALQGELGKAAGCGIHPHRPSVCRAFEASWSEGRPNPRCDQARARHGLPPLTPDDWIESPNSPDPGDGSVPPLSPAA